MHQGASALARSTTQCGAPASHDAAAAAVLEDGSGTAVAPDLAAAASTTTTPEPRPVAWHQAVRVSSRLYRTHKRPPRLPWHPSTTAAVGFVSTLAGAAYATPDMDAVAIVWRATPAGLARHLTRVAAAFATPPVLATVLSRRWWPGLVIAALEVGTLAAIDVTYEVSFRRAQKRWLAKPRNVEPPKSDKVELLRLGHLVGLGVAAESPHAADAMCESIAEHADLPIYLVASTPAHTRLYKRFGFEKVGPSWYGETPMVRQPGPLERGRRPTTGAVTDPAGA
jgi:hypothetical protein